MDRPQRARDLHDLAFLLTDYLEEANDADFERLLAAVSPPHVEHHTANAFVLGQDVARCSGAMPIARRFVAMLSTTHAWMLADMQRNGPAALTREDVFDATWRAFVRGLGVEP